MPARAIGGWVGRAAVFAALGLGFWAVAGLANAGGVGTTVVSGHAFEDGSDPSGRQSQATPMDFEWT